MVAAAGSATTEHDHELGALCREQKAVGIQIQLFRPVPSRRLRWDAWARLAPRRRPGQRGRCLRIAMRRTVWPTRAAGCSILSTRRGRQPAVPHSARARNDRPSGAALLAVCLGADVGGSPVVAHPARWSVASPGLPRPRRRCLVDEDDQALLSDRTEAFARRSPPTSIVLG